jgi:hypothetical protein
MIYNQRIRGNSAAFAYSPAKILIDLLAMGRGIFGIYEASSSLVDLRDILFKKILQIFLRSMYC